jgi:hypothetical protein
MSGFKYCRLFLQLMRTNSLILGLSALLILFCSATWAEEHDLVKVSQDPYTDPSAQHATEVEPVMVAHGDTIVTALQVGRFFGAGADNIGWATSKDGGKTWKHGFLTGTTTAAGGSWPAVSLPTIAYDRKHRTYLISMMPFDDQGNGRGVLVSRSLDGMKWSQPVLAASSLGANGHWLACDNSARSPHYGNCYDAFLDYSSPVANVNVLVASNDGGLTWGAPVSSPDQTAGLVSSIAIQPYGNLLVLGRNGGPSGDQAYAIRSVDGGHSLEATVSIATHQFMYPWLRADPNLTSGVDSHGTIYVVFPDCRFRSNCIDPGCRFGPSPSFCATDDLLLTKSDDGITWSALQRIPIDAVASRADHFIAGLAVLSEPNDDDERFNGDETRTRLALTYYYLPNGNLPDGSTCTSSTCEVNAGFISSDDGGRSWQDAAKIAGPMAQTWLVPTSAGEMVADYGSAVFVEGKPYGAFAIAGPPDPKTGVFNEAIYTAELPEGRE